MNGPGYWNWLTMSTILSALFSKSALLKWWHMLHVCLSRRPQICCCSDFESPWRAAVSPDCTFAWLLLCTDHIRYVIIELSCKLKCHYCTALLNVFMSTMQHQCRMSGELFLSQTRYGSTTPPALTSPQGPQELPVRNISCVSVHVYSIRMYMHFMGILYCAYRFAYILVRFEKTPLYTLTYNGLRVWKESWWGSPLVVRWVVTLLSLQCWSFHHCWVVLCACVFYRTCAAGVLMGKMLILQMKSRGRP